MTYIFNHAPSRNPAMLRLLPILMTVMLYSLPAQNPNEGKKSPAAPATKTSTPATTPAVNSAPKTGTQINYKDPVEVMQRGGPLMWPILLCSIAALTFGLERLISLRYSRVIPVSFVRRFQRALEAGQLDRARALDACRSNGSPIAAVFHAACRMWGRPAAQIEESVAEVGQREVAVLKRNLRALSATANVSTLLGLLGTVMGMIDAFNTVAAKGGLGRAELLANGIAEALLTTAFGLVVAIPATLLYAYFAGRVERLTYEMDCLAAEVTDLICAENINPNRTDSQPMPAIQLVQPVIAQPIPGYTTANQHAAHVGQQIPAAFQVANHHQSVNNAGSTMPPGIIMPAPAGSAPPSESVRAAKPGRA